MTAETPVASGEIASTMGIFSTVISFLCSAKYADSETGLIYYSYRYYQSSTGRWLSRDPFEEEGGANLYASDRNNAIGIIDSLGLASEGAPCTCCVLGTPKLRADLVTAISGYNVTFIANSITNVGGGCYSEVQPFWTTCYKGTAYPIWVPGNPYGPIKYNPYTAGAGGFAIVSEFKLEYLSCSHETGKWQKKTQQGGGPVCNFIHKYPWPWFGDHWECHEVPGWTGVE
jgi:RHS repeat-associated protein